MESLILIYADFRVKNNGYDEKGKEIMGFYSLASSFAVILNKLDNVDTAKKIAIATFIPVWKTLKII